MCLFASPKRISDGRRFSLDPFAVGVKVAKDSGGVIGIPISWGDLVRIDRWERLRRRFLAEEVEP